MRTETRNGALMSVSVITPPFRGQMQIEVTHDGLAAVFPDRFELHDLTADGLERIVRYHDERVPVTEALIDEWVNRAPPERRADQRGWIADVPMPEFVPTAQALVVDLEGNAWIRRIRTTGRRRRDGPSSPPPSNGSGRSRCRPGSGPSRSGPTTCSATGPKRSTWSTSGASSS